MRKLFTLAFAALLMVALAAPSFAAETTFEGQYKIRGWSNWNFEKPVNHLNSDTGRYDGYFDQRFRLTITHTRSEFLKAVVQIDLVEDVWGQQRNFRINNSTTGNMVRKAYIEFAMPKVGTFTLGKQPVVLGYGLAFADTGGLLDGVKWSKKWGPVGVSAMYFKWDENVDEADAVRNRDTDIWLLDLVYTPNDKHTIEVFGGYVNARTGFPISHAWEHCYPMAWPTFTELDQVHSNIGLVGIAYTGEIADMITLKGEFSYLFGRADLENWGRSGHARFSGYNLYLDASYHNDLLRAGVAFVHGSGDTEHGINADHYNVNFITADEFVFGNIIASGNGGMADAFGGGIGFDDDIENLTAIKLYFEISPMEKLTLNAAVIRAWWTEGLTNDCYGDGPHPVNYYAGCCAYDAWNGNSKDLGWEVDLGLSYEIMEGLTYTLATGVLFTGNSFDYIGDGGSHQEWGTMWTVNNMLIYEF